MVPQVNSRKYPYEVIFRSIQKLLMDTASSEYPSILSRVNYCTISEYANISNTFHVLLFRYLFVEAFFGDESLLYQVFEGTFFCRFMIHLLSLHCLQEMLTINMHPLPFGRIDWTNYN